MLKVESVHFAYRPDRPVLSGVSAAFSPGRVTAIIGPNGAGKSTLLRLLAGLSKAGSGRVTLEGRDVATIGARTLASRIAYVPQRPTVMFAFTVGQVVRLGRYAVGCDDGAVSRALESVQAMELIDEPFGTLSVGQQQRVTLARAIAQLDRANGPTKGSTALVADEPVSAMDPKHAIASMALLRSVARRGVSVVVVLHDLTLASCWADQAVVLDQAGSVVAMGTVDDALDPSILERVFETRFVRTPLGDKGEPHALTPVPALDDIL